MFLTDVNVLVYAYREDVAHHTVCHQWLGSVVNSQKTFAYSELVLSGFLRIVTHPKIFEMPASLSSAMLFVEQIRLAPNSVCIAPGEMHWAIFVKCVQQIEAKGNDIPDAYHAALALEWNCEWVTMDKGFKRFKGLKYKTPLDLLNFNA
jgi:uncharacterized protein